MASSNVQQKKKIVIICGAIMAAAVLIIVGALILGKSGFSALLNASAESERPSEHVSVDFATPDPNDVSAKLAAILTRTTMLEGTTVAGVDVGNMTIAEAKAAVRPVIDQRLADFSLSLTLAENSYPVTADALTLADNLDDVLVDAYEILRDDIGYDAVSAEADSIRANGRDFPVAIIADEEALRVYIADLAVDVDTPATNANVTAGESGIQYTDEVNGYGIDQEALFAAMETAIAEQQTTVSIPMTDLEPALTVEMLRDKYVLRAGFTTSFKNSSNNRKFNIRKAAGLVNGTVLKPGDVFSANDTLGVRSSKNGWKNAPAYIAGTHEDQPGGGVCQVSSTMYNAVVLSDLEIVFRRNHSMPVAYVTKGRDATINSVGNMIDFQFKNNTTDNIILVAFTDGNSLTIQVYGLPFANEEYDRIDIRTKQISHISYTQEITEDPTKDVGYEEVTRDGQDGYVVEAYKQYYKGEALIREELLNTSTYKMYTEQKTVGTKATPEPTAAPTSTPSPVPVTAEPTDASTPAP